MIRDDLLKEFEEIISGKRLNPALRLLPISIIDDTYDGPENKAQTIRFNPDHKANIFATFLMDKYPGGFGLYLLSCFMFNHLPPKERDKWIAKSRRLYEEIRANR